MKDCGIFSWIYEHVFLSCAKENDFLFLSSFSVSYLRKMKDQLKGATWREWEEWWLCLKNDFFKRKIKMHDCWESSLEKPNDFGLLHVTLCYFWEWFFRDEGSCIRGWSCSFYSARSQDTSLLIADSTLERVQSSFLGAYFEQTAIEWFRGLMFYLLSFINMMLLFYLFFFSLLNTNGMISSLSFEVDNALSSAT